MGDHRCRWLGPWRRELAGAAIGMEENNTHVPPKEER